MKGLPDFPPNYYARFSTKPVAIKPFDPQSRAIAKDCLEQLRTLLAGLSVELSHRGSTRYGIAGKGDVELSVYPSDEHWSGVLLRLENSYGKAGNAEENYVRFNSECKGYDIEIIVMKGQEAWIDRRLTEYLLQHPELLEEYERVKRAFAFSKREYQIKKDEFFRQVIANIPED